MWEEKKRRHDLQYEHHLLSQLFATHREALSRSMNSRTSMNLWRLVWMIASLPRNVKKECLSSPGDTR